MVVSPKIDSSPLQVGGMGSTGNCICNMRKYMYWYMAWQSKSHTPCWAFSDLSEDRRSWRDGIPPWEARWNTFQTWPSTCKHGTGNPTAANQPNENGETSNPRFRKFKHWSDASADKRTVFDRLVSDQIDGWMVGRSVGDRLDSKPVGWFNRPTNWIANKPAGKPTTDHKSDQTTDTCKQTKLYSNTNFGSHAFQSSAPKIWNKLPLEIKSAPPLRTVESRFKTHYFSKPPA